jgi:hypothetical protein
VSTGTGQVQWKAELHACAQAGDGRVTIVSPFVKEAALTGLLDCVATEHDVRLITRFNLRDVAAGASDLGALRRVLHRGGRVRGVRGLHSKVYVFGNSRAVVPQPNLTGRGLSGNQEFGCVSAEPGFIGSCATYVDQLWEVAGPDLTNDQLEDWDKRVALARFAGATATAVDALPDLGTVVPGAHPDGPLTGAEVDAVAPIDWPKEGQAFVKFFGEGDALAAPSTPVYDKVVESRSYIWCTYPPSKRPRQPRDGDTMFLGRLTTDGLRIFGRVLVMEHDELRDVATAQDIALRPWLERFPLYVRVFRVEALAGTLGDGFSIGELIDTLGTDAFPTTRERVSQQRRTSTRTSRFVSKPTCG